MLVMVGKGWVGNDVGVCEMGETEKFGLAGIAVAFIEFGEASRGLCGREEAA